MAKFQQNLNPSRLAVGAGSEGLMQLAQSLQSLRGTATGVAATALTQIRAEDAAKAKEMERHNKSLRDAYLAGINNDNRETISQLELESETDLQMFDQKANAYAKGVLAEVDPSARLLVSQDLDSKITDARIRIREKAIKQQKITANAELVSNYESASGAAFRDMRNGDKQAAARNLQEAVASAKAYGEANPDRADEVQAMIRSAERETVEQGLRKQYDDMVASEGIEAAIDDLAKRSKKVPRGFTPDEWDTYTRDQANVLNRQLAKQEAEAKENLKIQEKALSVERGKMFFNTDIPANPAKKGQDRKDVNAYFNEVSQEWQNLPPNEQINNTVLFVRNTGIIPDTVINSLNASMRSGNVDQATIAADLVGRIEEAPNSANALRDLPDETRALSKQVADSVRSGIDPAEAIEIARKNTFGLTEQQKEAIKIQTQEAAPELTSFLADQVDDAFDPSPIPFFGEEPDIPVDMQADYNVAFGKFMTLTGGNPDQAKALAFDSLKKIWAPSDIGGDRRFMRFAPEAFYSVDGFDNEWMDRQFQAEMEERGIIGAELSADLNTGRSSAPSYPILTTNENGIPDIVRDEETGLPLRWRPDFKATPEYKDMIEAPGKAIETARQKRKRKMEARANYLRRKVESTIAIQNRDAMVFGQEIDRDTVARRAINNLFALKKIDELEKKQLLDAYGVTK